ARRSTREALEDPLLIARSDSKSRVRYLDHDRACVLLPPPQGHASASRVLNRVRRDARDGLFEKVLVAIDGESRRARHRHSDVGMRRKVFCHPLENRPQENSQELRCFLVSLGAGEDEQRTDKSRQTRRLTLDDREETIAGMRFLLRASLQHFDGTDDGRERRPQFVSSVRGELPLRTFASLTLRLV